MKLTHSPQTTSNDLLRGKKNAAPSLLLFLFLPLSPKCRRLDKLPPLAMDDGRRLSTTAADALHAESAQVRGNRKEKEGKGETE